MPIAPPVVVYDCMIFVQAVASDRGPAFRCFELAEEHAVSLLVTAEILAEVRDVLGRTELRRRFRHLTDERVEEFLDEVLGFASMSAAPPALFSLPRDPSDEPYLNLAIHEAADPDHLECAAPHLPHASRYAGGPRLPSTISNAEDHGSGDLLARDWIMKDACTAANTSARKNYLMLVRRFPLRAVRTQDEYAQAGRVLDRLLARPGGNLSTGERDYLDALVLLVEDYERKHAQMVLPRRTPAQALKFIAGQSGIGPTALAKVLGTTHAMASLMLSGTRGISAQAARRLAQYFKVDAGLFI